MKTALKIIAICEVIRTVQITVDLILGWKIKKTTMESINKVGEKVGADLTPDNMARSIVKAVTENGAIK